MFLCGTYAKYSSYMINSDRNFVISSYMQENDLQMYEEIVSNRFRFTQ